MTSGGSEIVAWSRIYVGVHYPGDVFAGFLLASAGPARAAHLLA